MYRAVGSNLADTMKPVISDVDAVVRAYRQSVKSSEYRARRRAAVIAIRSFSDTRKYRLSSVGVDTHDLVQASQKRRSIVQDGESNESR